MKIIATGLFGVLLISPVVQSTVSQSLEPDQTLSVIAADYYENLMKEDPFEATYMGDYRYNDKLKDLSSEGRDKHRKAIAGFLSRLRRLESRNLNKQDRLTCDILERILQLETEKDTYKFYQLDVDQLNGLQVRFPQLMSYHPLKTEKDVQDLIARLRAYPDQIGQYLDNLKEGVMEGRTASCAVVNRVVSQANDMLKIPEEKSPFGKKAGEIPGDMAPRYRGQVLLGIHNYVYPAFAKLRDFLGNDYSKQCRDDAHAGIWAIPQGQDAYRYTIKEQTTMGLNENEIHRLGVEELSRIHAEMAAILKNMGRTENPKIFLEHMRSDPENFFKSRDEILEAARLNLNRAQSRLSEYFGRLPKAGCEVKAVEAYREKDMVAAYYYRPPMDGSRPAIYYVNTYNPSSRPRYTATVLAVHESVPGHHIQFAFAQEASGLPKFRQYHIWAAFAEGWGLYAERLADEMGLYPDNLSRLGMLTYQAWRACRLAVDTGIHAEKWSRQKAVDFMKENTILSEAEIVNEVDRYIMWPGQALAYEIGRKEISDLRNEAAEKLGNQFDLKSFHDTVLKNGFLPLPVLRKTVGDWIMAARVKR